MSVKCDCIVVWFLYDIVGCVVYGYQVVEFDNFDFYMCLYGDFILWDVVVFVIMLVWVVYCYGFVVGQKNIVQFGSCGCDQIGFDFVVVEECDCYWECVSYICVYGDWVIDIEYMDDLCGLFVELCCCIEVVDMMLCDCEFILKGFDGYVFCYC